MSHLALFLRFVNNIWLFDLETKPFIKIDKDIKKIDINLIINEKIINSFNDKLLLNTRYNEGNDNEILKYIKLKKLKDLNFWFPWNIPSRLEYKTEKKTPIKI